MSDDGKAPKLSDWVRKRIFQRFRILGLPALVPAGFFVRTQGTVKTSSPITRMLYLKAPPLSRLSRTLLSRLNIITDILFLGILFSGFLAIAIAPVFGSTIGTVALLICAIFSCLVLKNPRFRAGLQNVMGSSWAEDRLGERADNIERAIHYCEEALTVFRGLAVPGQGGFKNART